MAVFSMLRRKAHRKGRKARRRHNPRFGVHRPTLIFGGPKGWHRTKRSRLFKRSTRINPKRRWRKSYRRNPGLPFNIGNVTMNGAKVAGGIAIGFLGMPLITRFAPASVLRFRNFFGVIYLVAGAAAATLVKNRTVKDVALALAAVGVYDLVASNLRMLGLPTLPDGIAKTSATGVGASYVPQLAGAAWEKTGAGAGWETVGASYQAAGEDNPYDID